MGFRDSHSIRLLNLIERIIYSIIFGISVKESYLISISNEGIKLFKRDHEKYVDPARNSERSQRVIIRPKNIILGLSVRVFFFFIFFFNSKFLNTLAPGV